MSRPKSFKRILSLLCTICLLFSLFVNSVSALAFEAEAGSDGATGSQTAASETPPDPSGSGAGASDSEGPIGADVLPSPEAEAAALSSGEAETPSDQEDEGPSPADDVPVPSDDAQGDPSSSHVEAQADQPSSPSEAEAEPMRGAPASGEDEPASGEDEPASGEDEPASGEDDPASLEEMEEAPEAALPEDSWNEAPILGSGTAEGVIVQLTAPEGSFPQGTKATVEPLCEADTGALLSAVGTGDAAVGFDIFFSTAEGQKVQPREGSLVTLSFTVRSDSVLADGDASGAILHLYHFHGNGAPAWLKSIGAPAEGVARITVQANAFSSYLVVKAPQPAAKAQTARARSAETNLAAFLTDLFIDAEQNAQGEYVIRPDSTYTIRMTFSEREGLQFADEELMTYSFPSGVVVGNIGQTQFPIEVKAQGGTFTVAGNTFEVVGGQLRVRFNRSDPNFERLKAAANATFKIEISSFCVQSSGHIEFGPGILKEFAIDNTSNVIITKDVVYDGNSDTAAYTLKVRSVGRNENVIIDDRLTGTALRFNGDVRIVSSVHGSVSPTVEYAGVPNGFRVTIPRMVHGEELTLNYTATVDNDKITGNGTVSETNNRATVKSDQVPVEREATADFSGKVSLFRIKKQHNGSPVTRPDGFLEATWTVEVNKDRKLTAGGKTIVDWVGSSSRPFMCFDGPGVEAEVTLENGTTERRSIPWSELVTEKDSLGRIVRWEYTPPETDGKAAYTITCKTVIDPSTALGALKLINYARFAGKETSAQVTIESTGGESLLIEKAAEGTTATASQWRIAVTIPSSGLPALEVTDNLPKLTHGGTTYLDHLVGDSLQVEGLLPDEAWSLYVGSDAFRLTFFQDRGKTTQGALPSPDGKPRQIVIRFRTEVDQAWLTLAVEDGYATPRLYAHYNYAYATSGAYKTEKAQAFVTPIRPNLVKSFGGRDTVTIDGRTFPLFRYSLALFGPMEDGITIRDAFDTSYLRLYEDSLHIFGGVDYAPTDSNGEISATATADGMDIQIARFPKHASGRFYPYYSIEYTLIAKDAAALAALNEAAALSQEGVSLENTATWGSLTSGRLVKYTYFPYVDKDMTDGPSEANGYVATFRIIVNRDAADLDPESEVLAVKDTLSANLRFLPETLVISPAVPSVNVTHDAENNVLTFLNIPDGTRLEITYQTKVLGTGSVTFSNRIEFGKYKKDTGGTVVVESSGGGGGSASNPSITLIKLDATNLSKTLPGATFRLYYLAGGTPVGVTDKHGQPVTFITGSNGTVLIEGDQSKLGWTLWTGRTYQLVETDPPVGYMLNSTPVYFTLSETPSSQSEYDITGCTITVQNTPLTVSIPVKKQWVGPAAQSVTIHLTADGTVIDTVKLTEAESWQHTFAGLPKYDGTDGHAILYDVKEDAVAGYDPGRSGSAEAGFIFTNTNAETRSIAVEKRWVGTPRSGVTVRLLADGVQVAHAELNANSAWKHTFGPVPRYDAVDGHEIVYTITEDTVSGYTTSFAGNAEDGFVVTNTKKPSEKPGDTPKTGDPRNLHLYLLAMLLSAGGLVWVGVAFKRRKQQP